ncbi:MAG TPA: OB-fold domain-containing protein [Elusimicrobiota bacterium]|nr:OB-fold domain-containing protein [Elusimicrobiota bacterium]
MIASLRGTLLEKNAEGAVLEVAGVGYSVLLSETALAELPPLGEEVLLSIAESVGMYGGGVTLYGFLRVEEKRLFNVLRENVPGTGAKKALELMDKALKSLPDFRRAVLEKDTRALVSLFGFTRKTAEKMVAGLDGKMESLPISRGAGPAGMASSFDETIQALVALGYKEPAARQAAQTARAAVGSEAAAKDLVREALRHLSGRGGL